MRIASRLSAAFLVASNLLPMAGVLLWDWDVATLLILYWAENLIIGAATLIKMLSRSLPGGLFQSLFFSVHYGGFCGVHGLFLLMLVAKTSVQTSHDWPFVLVFIEILVDVVRKVFEIAPPEWLLGFAALALSHAVSLVQNYFLGGERERVDSKELMVAPYKRVMVLHVALIFGGMGVAALGSPLPLLLVLIVGKIAIDLYAHLKEHAGEQPSDSEAPATTPHAQAR